MDLNTEEKLHLTVRNEVFPKVSLASNIVRSKACQEQWVSVALADISVRALESKADFRALGSPKRPFSLVE